ncbi:MAG: hypothetical protein M1118_00180 [Chloroflexi bacterium]|nr:hypothetical protein [Chloroflexota bacterium]
MFVQTTVGQTSATFPIPQSLQRTYEQSFLQQPAATGPLTVPPHPASAGRLLATWLSLSSWQGTPTAMEIDRVTLSVDAVRLVAPGFDTSVVFAVEGTFRQFEQLRIVLPQLAEVRAYVTDHPDVLTAVIRGAQAARDQFEADVDLSLEVYHDPEVDDAYLTLYVRSTDYGDDFFEALERVDSAYEADLAKKSGWFLVTTDLRPPR